MDMGLHCPDCDRTWWPYETVAGCCPQCGGGTRRTHERPDGDTVIRLSSARADAERRARREDFERYYAEREARRSAEPPSAA
jgi:hypothetical protein